MKSKKPLLWILGIAAVMLLVSIDFNGLSDWLGNRVILLPKDQIPQLNVNTPWKVEVKVHRRDPFGNNEEIILPDDQYRLSMTPLDDHTERLAQFENGAITCPEAAMLHLKFQIDLLPESKFRFFGKSTIGTWNQLLAVGIEPIGEWLRVDVKNEPVHVQNHLQVVSRSEYDGNGGTYFPLTPDEVTSTKDLTLVCDAAVTTLRGNSSLHYNYFSFDGSKDHNIADPPLVRGSPQTCLLNNQWILAGGNLPEEGYSIPQIVLAYDLKTKTWSQLPTLPDETSHVTAAFVNQNQLAVYSPTHDDTTDEWGPTTLYVLRGDKWAKEGELKYDFGVGDTFSVENGIIFIATQSMNNPIKTLMGGYMKTIGVAPGYSAHAPVVVVDDRILQWTNEGVYELHSSLRESPTEPQPQK